jgi:hypothetical protein
MIALVPLCVKWTRDHQEGVGNTPLASVHAAEIGAKVEARMAG